MYKLLLIAAPLLACVLAAPAPGQDIVLEKFASAADEHGFGYQYSQSDGQDVAQQGQGESVSGYYSYISPEGIPVSVSYVADANGYQPQSELLPTPPPIPEAILRSIEYIQQHPTPEELADREVRKTQL